MKDYRGAQFDILDKAVAARAYELYARPYIARQDYDSWISDFNQLGDYARANSDVAYIARQWRDEEPRYANAPGLLLAKVRVANPINYDTSIPVSGDCGCSKIPQLSYSPSVIPPGNYGSSGSHGATNLFFPGTLGDSARNLFSPNSLPFLSMPQGQQDKLIDKSQVGSGILVALIVGAILWGVHYLTKKTNARL